MKLALLPINVRVGDFAGNLKIHCAELEKAQKMGAELAVFPELSLIGYSPQDLLLRPDFASRCEQQLADLEKALKKYPNLAVIVGTALPLALANPSSPTTKPLANCAVFLHRGKRELRIKTLLPFYDVFSESRYFESSASFAPEYSAPIEFAGKKLGLLICEDSWYEQALNGQKIHRRNPAAELVAAGAEILLNISASPFDRQKKAERRATMLREAQELAVPVAYVNHFGAQDEILFDGDAFACTAKGELCAEKRGFQGDALLVELSAKAAPCKAVKMEPLADLETALVTGLRDYAQKNGFPGFVLGLSGGIDSALVAALAVRAVGPDKVMGLAMPSKFSSTHSIEDAEELAKNLGIRLQHFPIKMLYGTFTLGLKPFFQGLSEDITEENLQSRLRGVAVMAFANKFGLLGLATGNKSELAMGYSTLYGDLCGAVAPIGDLYKTEVYALARHLNEKHRVIPERTLTKAPSAELRPGQTDQDSLPPYELLDALLLELIEGEASAEAIFQALHGRFPQLKLELVSEIERKLRLAEYKRRQAPVILRVSRKAFGQGRRYPITAFF